MQLSKTARSHFTYLPTAVEDRNTPKAYTHMSIIEYGLSLTKIPTQDFFRFYLQIEVKYGSLYIPVTAPFLYSSDSAASRLYETGRSAFNHTISLPIHDLLNSATSLLNIATS
jgi:hypothetical protein